MDTPLANILFRRLFRRYCTCQSPRSRHPPALHASNLRTARRQAGTYSRLKRNATAKAVDGPAWAPRDDTPSAEKLEEFKDYEFMTADELRLKGRRPRRVKMLMRDFIEDSLYNPTYGYFTTQAHILTTGPPISFPSLPSEAYFHRLLSERYIAFEDRLDAHSPNDTRQLWHTPSELFRPYYAEAMARYLVANYKISLYPYRDLVIFELGAGNATFALNVLDHIRATDPDVYARTRYTIVEISPQLAGLQRAAAGGDAEHAERLRVVNKSIFEWREFVPEPCFFVALEVVDNFGHDAVRYDAASGEPRQALVCVDAAGELYEVYSRSLDPGARRYLRVRDAACRGAYPSPLSREHRPGPLRRLRARATGAPLMSDREYLPTRLLSFFDVLASCFPAHRLLLSDFHSLPDAVPGLNAPVVQTRYRRRTVPVTTPLVRQGFFDIFFPTDFGVVEDVYRAVTGRLTRVMLHEEFLERWGEVAETRCKNGENPMVGWYRNASVLITV